MTIDTIIRELNKFGFNFGIFVIGSDIIDLSAKHSRYEMFVHISLSKNSNLDLYTIALKIGAKILINEICLSKLQFEAELESMKVYLKKHIDTKQKENNE